MFTNCKGLTIFERIEINKAPAWIRHETGDVYWQPAQSQTDGKNRQPDRSIFVSIPENSTDYLPKISDKAVISVINSDAPPVEALTVMSVKDLRFGSKKVRHIEIILG